MSNERIDFSELEDLQESWEERLTEEGIKEALGNWLFDNGNELIAELKRCYERIDYLESVAEEYRQERPEEYCANCYAYLSEYDGDGVKECLCSDCEASEEVTR